MITKQQQLEWLANNLEKWKSGYDYAVVEKAPDGYLYVRWPSVCASGITKKEWRQERDKMQKQDSESECEVMTLSEAIAHADEKSRELNGGCAANHSLLARWLTEYRDILSKSDKPEVDNSWHERGEFPPDGTICEMIDDKNTWLECEIISHKDGSCIGWITSRKSPFYTYDKSEFRPLRTEREKAIEQMNELVGDIEKYPTWRDAMAALYDAGYQKVANK